MEKVIVTCDSGVDPLNMDNMIPATIIENKDKTYRDVIDIDSKTILEKTKDGSTFTTASPILSDFIDKFESILKDKKDVVHLSMSSGISEGSFNSASLAANELNDEYENKIYVVDTFTGATGGTLISEIAEHLRRKGYDAKKIVNYLNDIKKRIASSFYVPDPKGFIRSGRNKSELCKKEKALLIGLKTAVIAGIKFRVDFNDEGNLYTKNIFKAKRKDGMMNFTKNIVNNENKESFESSAVVVGNLNQKYVNMDDIVTYLEDLHYFDRVIRRDINGVVASYGCDDLCGISLIKKPLG